MNQRIETAPDTLPTASTKHDARVLGVAARYMAIARSIAETVALHHGDQAERLGELQDELTNEYLALCAVREAAYGMAAEDAAEQAEQRWNDENDGGMPR